MLAYIAKFQDKKTALAGLEELRAEIEQGNAHVLVESFQLIEALVDLVSDKQKPVAKAAEDVLTLIFSKVAPYSAKHVLKNISKGLDGKAKPASKEVALTIIENFANQHPKAIAREIEWIVHPIVFLMNDIKASVKSKAKSCMTAIASCSGNKDLENFIPVIVKANESIKNVQPSVEELAGCIFVQNVESPALAVLTPVLWRGLQEKSEATIRRCLVIVDNMCKLVDDPREGYPLLKEIYGLIVKKSEEISDPECRDMCFKTIETLKKIEAAGRKPVVDAKQSAIDLGADMFEFSKWTEEITMYVQDVVACLGDNNATEVEFVANLEGFLAANVATGLRAKIAAASTIVEEEFHDDDEASPDLYKGAFSLAYGTLTLLRDAKLHLKKHKFYGLLGPNNCGKTTLMRAISREQVEGFPKRDELRTIFVEHEVEERELLPPGTTDEAGVHWPLGKFNIDLDGIDFVVDTCNNVYKREPKVTREESEIALGEMGFKNPKTGVNMKAAATMTNPITTYSGGWKVKMQLACAKIVNADILMMDEPTGHLDVKNVAWMKEWLRSFPGSIIATSADSPFLDDMATHIVDFHERKLRQFKGTPGSVLTEFVAAYPEKKSYFELSNNNQKFIFPEPGPLQDVKSKGRSILKMNNVTFRYPTHEKPTVKDICLSVCMMSRVGVVGANGAGKSTAIKLLIGELQPEAGTIYKHNQMRLAYVAQHAFHHLENHMDKTPVQYIMWRFAGNDDRESLENQNKELNDDEEALRAVPWCIDSMSGVVRKCVPGEKRDVPIHLDVILNRRRNKQKKYEYEVKQMHKPIDAAVWIERDTMVNMGYEKMVCREDEKQAAAAGLMSKPLTAPSVEKALKDFGLDAECASHNPIASLSGGQKVKVVLAAAMWQNPHILILDEPTNYLDRDGLGALSLGLKEYGGGVVIISHNMEFTNSICDQKWIMEAGLLRAEGTVYDEKDGAIEDNGEGADEIVDGAGNVIKVNKQAVMTQKDIKKALKEIEKRLKEHKKKNTMSEAEYFELDEKKDHLTSLLETK